MRILLLGEYSNLHWTLAQGLLILGHEVCVISDGDTWKGFKNDRSLKRKDNSAKEGLKYVLRLLSLLPKMRGYDVVQIINPIFLDLKADKNLIIYKYLRRNNKKVFLGANGVDHFWIKTCLDGKSFRYSDFDIFGKERMTDINKRMINEWINSEKEQVNKYIAEDCNGITCCLYEYYKSYIDDYPEKTYFAPLPVEVAQIDVDKMKRLEAYDYDLPEMKYKPLNIFIGIQKNRSSVKGTDIMDKVLKKLHSDYPDKFTVTRVESVPYYTYKELLSQADVILDQIYSYTPAMNALLAMSKGIIAVSGGEPENYEIINEKEIFPIINVLPDEDDIYNKLESLILNPDVIGLLSHDSIAYVLKHHNNVDVAKRYLEIWEK